MEPIYIAVISTPYAFKVFLRDLVMPKSEPIGHDIKFIQIDDDIHKIRSHRFNSYVIHYSAFDFKYLDDIISSVQQRLVKINNGKH